MSNLNRRVTKLEAGQPGDENIVCVRAPMGWPDDRCRAQAEELIGNRFNGEVFTLSVGRGHNVQDFEIVYAMTSSALDALVKHIGKNPRRITDGHSHQYGKEAR